MSKITEFCIDECRKQDDLTLEAVAGMVEGYCFVQKLYEHNRTLMSNFTICVLAKLIKPQNEKGYRQTPVTFANGQRGVHHSMIERAMNNLIEAHDFLSPSEFYYEFERIHPFEDGNGRVGAILYNWKNGTLYDPTAPPDLF